MPKGRAASTRLAEELDMASLDTLSGEPPSGEVIETASRFLDEHIRGRLIILITP